jgi:hypothetical protein
MSNLQTFADPHGSGGYVFPGNSGPDAFTTSGIPQALALKPLGAATVVIAGSAPPPAVVTTATPTPTATPSSVPVPTTGAVGPPDAGRSGLVLALLCVGLAMFTTAAWAHRGARIP